MHGSILAHRIETTVAADGTVVLDRLPFRAGDSVEVIVMRSDAAQTPHDLRLLRGIPVHYLRPFEPVAADEWDTAQ